MNARLFVLYFSVLILAIGITGIILGDEVGANGVSGTTTLVSHSMGVQANDLSANPSTSADGRFVAFVSLADNLVADDTAGNVNVYVHDRQTGQTTLISRATDTTPAGFSNSPSISADGRYVAFESVAANLVDDDGNGTTDIFVYDRVMDRMTLVTRHSDGTQANSWSIHPAISGNGQFVTFASTADNLVDGEAMCCMQVYLHNLQTGKTSLVSQNAKGKPGYDDSTYPALSADGRYVVFESGATNLVDERDENGGGVMGSDVFVYDIQTAEISRISHHTDGTQGDSASVLSNISADGQFVSFQSFATNLIDQDLNGVADIFVHDRKTGETMLVSRHSDGTIADSWSSSNAISGDGRFVVFESWASNLVDDDENEAVDIFFHDRSTGSTVLVSRHSNGTQGNNGNQTQLSVPSVAVSAFGEVIIFESYATNLIDNDLNGAGDIFAHVTGIEAPSSILFLPVIQGVGAP